MYFTPLYKRQRILFESYGMKPADHIKAMKKHKKEFHFWRIAAEIARNRGYHELIDAYDHQAAQHQDCADHHEYMHDIKSNPMTLKKDIDRGNAESRKIEGIARNKGWMKREARELGRAKEHREVMHRAREITDENERRDKYPSPRTERDSRRMQNTDYMKGIEK